MIMLFDVFIVLTWLIFLLFSFGTFLFVSFLVYDYFYPDSNVKLPFSRVRVKK